MLLPRRGLALRPPRFSRGLRAQAQHSNGPEGPHERAFPRQTGLHSPPLAMATPRQLSQYLDQFVVGQDYAKKVLSVAVFNHYQRIHTHMAALEANAYLEERRNFPQPPYPSTDPAASVSTAHIRPLRKPQTLPPLPTQLFDKSNVLIIGPTGSGKTLLVRTLAKILDVPFSVSDATSFTQAGYVGDDVDVCIQRLVTSANGDPVRASMGIVYIDEVDKIAKKSGTDGTRDVGGEGVQQSLLRMMEGSTVTVAGKGGDALGGKSDSQYHVDTTNVLFVLSGAFVGLDNVVKTRLTENRGAMGFSSGNFFTSTKVLDYSIDPSDLVKYGFIPEFISRVPSIATLSPLTIADMRRILTEVKGSLISQYQAQFGSIGVEIKFTSAALDEVCRKALERGGGARALRGILERVLLEPMHDVPGSHIRHVLITDRTIRGEGPAQCWPQGDATLSFWEAWAAEEREYREQEDHKD
ncbi:hypothetical protein MIND_00715400 [Mycena indigotica]|uniref:ClpX, ATPase regulatory subunit n=1 Tax=Mycena indigotica TaxID=2126181 RepID=A0A8H6SMD2_9AGAR|nr:uncharacterized protein MIND_00715400 [Mycena indigotica]KAF7301500.1 hypothetical protein MIND_00715400 [Mycena indigotica]